MMSDHTVQQDEGQCLDLVLKCKNIGDSLLPSSEQWIARWTQASKVSASRDCSDPNAVLSGNKVDQIKRQDSCKEFRLLSINMNRQYSYGCKDTSRSAYANIDKRPCALQSGKIAEAYRKRFMSREVTDDFYSCKESFGSLEKVSAKQLTGSSIKWKSSAAYHFQNLGVSNSEMEHFPMFDINRKIETIMASKKSCYGGMHVKMKKGKLPLCDFPAGNCLVEFSPESWLAAEHGFRNTAEAIKRSVSFLPYHADDIGEIDPAAHCCVCDKTNRISCIRNKTDSIYYQSSWKSLVSGSTHLRRNFSPNSFQCPVLPEEHGREVTDDFYSRKRLRKTDNIQDVHGCPSKIPKCSLHYELHCGSHRNMNVEENEEFLKFSNTTLIANKMGAHQFHRSFEMRDSTFTQAKESALSEILTIKTKENYVEEEVNTEPISNCVGINNHLTKAPNELSDKSKTMCIDICRRPISLPGEKISRQNEGDASPNMRIFKSTSSSPTQQAVSGNMELGSSDTAASVTNDEASASGTETMAAGYNASHIRKAELPSSIPLPDSSSEMKTCSRWVNRFQHNHGGSGLSLCAERFTKNDNASSSEILLMFSLNYDNHKCVKKQHKFEKTMILSENVNPSFGDSQGTFQTWIRRWRCNGPETVSPIASIPVEKENVDLPPERFESKMFASIGAMALMGKSMNNYRPCSFRRKGASVVWNA